MNAQQLAKDATILRVLTGSRLYGTATEASDYDYRSVFVAPVATKVGLLGYVEDVKLDGDDDVAYEVKKFFQMAAGCNPNILDILFAPDSAIVTSVPKGKHIRDNKELFLSTRVRYTFGGYAHQQLLKLNSHHRWIEEYPQGQEILVLLAKHFENKVIDYYWIFQVFGGDVARHITGKNRDKYEISKEVLSYAGTLFSGIPYWDRYTVLYGGKTTAQYWTWRLNRNPKRAAVEDRAGYDTKHAAHLIRLLLGAKQILLTGTYNPVLSGETLETVLSVLRGQADYTWVIAQANILDNELEQLYNEGSSPLPKQVDMHKINNLLLEISL